MRQYSFEMQIKIIANVPTLKRERRRQAWQNEKQLKKKSPGEKPEL